MTLTYGSLFSGTGMLDEGVQSVLGGELSWYAEFDDAASKVMAHHYPGIPNLGDVTKVDWASVPHIDILTGGSPCQDLSHAGKRAGMTAGTRSNLWVQMREAIAVLRPRLVVWENVRGALSASADSDLEPCPGCVGDPDDGAVLRALGRVLGDLADLGYDARWYGLRAADVGAAHGRFRVFLAAVPADADVSGLEGLADQARTASTGRHRHPVASVGGSSLTLLPTPKASNNENRSSGVAKAHQQAWGQYAAAIARAEQAIGRPAPPPTEIGPKGAPRLSPRFVEFLMMLPEGWVTDVAGLSRNDQLKMLGNGVVPAQCAAALRAFLWDAYGIGAAA